MTVKGSVFRLFAEGEGRRLTKRKFPVKETSVSLLRKLRIAIEETPVSRRGNSRFPLGKLWFLTKETLVSRQGNNGFSL